MKTKFTLFLLLGVIVISTSLSACKSRCDCPRFSKQSQSISHVKNAA